MNKNLQMSPLPKIQTEAELEDSKRREKRQLIRKDIKIIEEALLSDDIKQLSEIHRNMDVKYGAHISKWYDGMRCYSDNEGFVYDELDKESLVWNLKCMKVKVESLLIFYDEPLLKSYGTNSNNVNINVNNIDIDVSVTFEQSRQQVGNMTSLTNEQTREILEKLKEIEDTINGNETKKSKWEKIKPILIWLADKSFDVGMVFLPHLLKIK